MLDNYRIIRKLGTGGTSTVYLVEHQLLHSLRVMKCMKKDSSYGNNFVEESRMLSQLHHERIPIMYEWEVDDQNYYIIEEYFDGESLKSYILNQEHISEDSIVRFSLQICEVIRYLHTLENPIIYLDMKPENILVTSQGIKLIDFGSSRYKNDKRERSVITGTIGYAAPEQYVDGNLDEKTDIYGIGMIMYFMATRTILSNITCIEHIDKECTYSRRFSYVIDRCIQKDPSHRYLSVEKLMQELNKLIKRYDKSKECCRSTSLSIAVAGLQPKVGTTHIALAISKYLNHIVGPSIYIEKNKSMHIADVINWKGDFKEQDGLYVSSYLKVLPYNMHHSEVDNEEQFYKGYIAVVKDYGILQDNSIDQFVEADMCFLVTLSKPWEVKSSLLMETRRLIQHSNLLVNLTTDTEFQEILDKEQVENIYRIPYIGNLLIDKYDTYVWNTIHTILLDSLSDRNLTVYKKGRGFANLVQSIYDWLKRQKEHSHA